MESILVSPWGSYIQKKNLTVWNLYHYGGRGQISFSCFLTEEELCILDIRFYPEISELVTQYNWTGLVCFALPAASQIRPTKSRSTFWGTHCTTSTGGLPSHSSMIHFSNSRILYSIQQCTDMTEILPSQRILVFQSWQIFSH